MRHQLEHELLLHGNALRGLARDLVGESHADDLLQETALQALTSPPRRPGPLGGWLAAVVRHLACRHHRGERRRQRREQAVARREAQAADTSFDDEDALRRLTDAVLSLPAPYRRAVFLRYLKGLTPPQIAAECGEGAETIKSRLHRGLALLRERLDRDGSRWRAGFLAAFGLPPLASTATLATTGVLLMGSGIKLAACGVAAALAVAAALLFAGEPAGGPAPESVTGSQQASSSTTGGMPSAANPSASERTEQPAEAPAPERPAAPAPDEMWGRVVVAGTASPIPGAEVQLLHCDADEFWNIDLAYAERVTNVARTQSGTDGRFRFPVARARKHRLHVRAGGYAPATVMACTGGSEVVIGLSRGASIEGIVRCQGVALFDVPVRIAVVAEGTELGAGRTDVSGAFRFSGLQPADVFVQVRSPHHTQEWKQIELRDGALHRVEVDLQPGREVRGRVLEATTRTPVVDAELSDSWTFGRKVRSGTDGTFRMALADRSFVPVYVRATGYASATRNIAGQFDGELEFALVRGAEVSGRFVTADGTIARPAYAAVASPYMAAPGMGGTDWIRADVGPDGRFLALGLRPDQHYWLYVRGPGYGTRVHALARQLASGERVDTGDVVLRAPGGIEGRVVDDAGQPVAGARVDITGTNADSRAWLPADQKVAAVTQFESRDTRTDQLGRFRFTSLAAGDYTVSMRPKWQDRSVTAKVTVRDGAIAEGIELTVATGLVIEGQLRYADGRAIGDEAAEIHLTATRPDHSRSSARVQHGGRFRFAGLTEGSYTVSMTMGPPGWALLPREVAAGTSELQLVLDPAAHVAGRVVDAQGQGVKAQVFARPEGSSGGSALHTTEADGTFRIEVPADFLGTLGAHGLRDWMLQAQVAGVSAGQSGVVLQLKPFESNVPEGLRGK